MFRFIALFIKRKIPNKSDAFWDVWNIFKRWRIPSWFYFTFDKLGPLMQP